MSDAVDTAPEEPSEHVLLDLYPGNGLEILGTAMPEVMQAIAQQASQPSSPTAWQNEFCERLAAATFGTTAALTPCGDLAIEWAIAAARVRGISTRGSSEPKFKVITFVGDYHGRTFAGRAAAGDPSQQRDLGPLVAGFTHCPPGDVAAVANAIDEQTAAILVQPIQTHDEMRMVSSDFFSELRRLADENQLLLMVDETRLPIGASGQLCCSASWDATPDCLMLSAALAGGLPLGAVVLADALANDLRAHPVLQHTAVHPLIAAAAATTLRVIEEQELLEQVQKKAALLASWLAPLQEDFEFVRSLRNWGLITALDLDLEAQAVQTQLRAAGVLVGTAGGHTLRLQPALTIDEAQLQQAVDSLQAVFQTMEREPAIQ